MINSKTINYINKNLTMRYATTDIKLEKSNCNSCGFNDFSNIGTYTCAKCGGNK